MRKVDMFLALEAGLGVACAAVLVLHPFLRERQEERVAREARLVAELGLTDICLFTETRYTRHLSQADLHAAFQDNPAAPEHFPSGSMVTPPPHFSHVNADSRTFSDPAPPAAARWRMPAMIPFLRLRKACCP